MAGRAGARGVGGWWAAALVAAALAAAGPLAWVSPAHSAEAPPRGESHRGRFVVSSLARARPHWRFGEPPEPPSVPWQQRATAATIPLPLARPWSRPLRCPVLYTHEVWSRPALRGLLQGLLAAGYRPTRLSVVEHAMAGRLPPPPGCLVLTFDDGLYSQYEHALPVLAELRVPAVFFAMPGYADGVHRYMGATELRALREAGHEVMAHTCNHPSLPMLAARNRPALMAELVDCRQRLEAITGEPAPYLAYPHGAFDPQVQQAVREAGYRAAFTTRPAATLPANAPFALPRILFNSQESVGSLVSRLRAAGG